MSKNKSIQDFFKPNQSSSRPATRSTARPSPDLRAPLPPRLKADSVSPLKPRAANSQKGPPPLAAPRFQGNQGPTSSLSSSTASSNTSTQDPVPKKANIATNSKPTPSEIPASDDEDSDSDSLPAMDTFFSAFAPKPNPAGRTINPSTPRASRYQNHAFNFDSSPLPVITKYKFEIADLIRNAKEDEAIEASSKRVKALLASKEDSDDDIAMQDHDGADANYGALLENVMIGTEDRDIAKVNKALERTEATITEKDWYFFDTSKKATLPERTPFPTSSVPANWKRELGEPQARQQSFSSGFVEEMISFGNALPDEIFLWILDEICFEPSDSIRTSYLNVLNWSATQLNELIDPEQIEKLFRNLGGRPSATVVKDMIEPVHARSDPYPDREWENLLSVITFLGSAAAYLQQVSRTHAICLLLRLSIDRMVTENIDIWDQLQKSLSNLCQWTSNHETSDTSYQRICRNLYSSVKISSLRLNLVRALPSTHPSSHDLRRRLAMCFFFTNLSYSKINSHSLIDLNKVMDRLEEETFIVSSETDYRELTALIHLLDISIDDGRLIKLNYEDKTVERNYNEDVETLVSIIDSIVRRVGGVSNGFISRLEAKETLEIVSQRIAGTVRTKPKPKQSCFDEVGAKTDDLEAEKQAMASFVTKMKAKGSSGTATGGIKKK